MSRRRPAFMASLTRCQSQAATYDPQDACKCLEFELMCLLILLFSCASGS